MPLPVLKNVRDNSVTNHFQIECFPNQASNSVKIVFSLFNDNDVNQSLLDITGRLVKKLYFQKMSGGIQSVNIDCSELQTGIYFITLKTNQNCGTIKIVIAK